MLDPAHVTQPTSTPTEKLSDLILTGTQGFFTCTTEIILYWLALSIELPGSGRSPGAVYKAMQRAENNIYGQKVFNELEYDKFRSAWYYLHQKGLIAMVKDKITQPAITQTGLKRLQQNFPVYLTERPWDGKVYLVTYDIAEQRKKKRDLLREKLKRLGCAMLQASVYVSVYNPREILRDWSHEHGFTDSIIVSDVGKDGNVAGNTIPELIGKLYCLDEIDAHYRQFINNYREYHRPKQVNPWQLNIDWATCLEEDPQLPFELLPEWFSGEQAFKLYQKLALPETQELFFNNETDHWQLANEKYLREKKIKNHDVEYYVQEERGTLSGELE